MAKEIEEIWLIKDKENQTCGFVLDQDEAFCSAVELLLESLPVKENLDSTEELKYHEEVEQLLENKEYRKAYYKTRDYWYWEAYQIERVYRRCKKY